MGWSVAVTVTLTGVMPPRMTWLPAFVRLVFRRTETIWMVVLVDSVVVVKLPMKPGLMKKPEGVRVTVAVWVT